MKIRSTAEGQGQHGTLRAVGFVLLAVAVLPGLWIGFDRNKGGGANQKGDSSAARGNVAKRGKMQEAEKLRASGTAASGSVPNNRH